MRANTGKWFMAVIVTAGTLLFASANVVTIDAAEIDGSGFPRLETLTENKGASFGGYNASPATPWNGYDESLGGNWWSSWLGHYAQMEGNWIWHNCHAFLWIAPGSTIDSIWMFSYADQSWFWTNWGLYNVYVVVPFNYAYLYSAADGAWLFYAPGTKDPRWFFNFSTGQWFSRP
jgi:hypothetical protein